MADNKQEEKLKKKFRTTPHGNNWMQIRQGFTERVMHWKQYMVCDVMSNDGGYILDRFFVQHKVHVSYPHGQNMVSTDYIHCVIYPISFAEEDEEKVQLALDDMYRYSTILTYGEEYRKMLEDFKKQL